MNATSQKITWTDAEALEIATRIADDRATVSIHEGSGSRDRAVRVTGCDFTTGRKVAFEIANATGWAARATQGFVAVWFEPSL